MTASLLNRLLGLGLIGFGIWMLTTPLWVGEWALALLAIPMMIAGAGMLVRTFRKSGSLSSRWAEYGRGVLLLSFGPLLFAAPNIALANLKWVLTLYLLVSACLSGFEAFRSRSERPVVADVLTAVLALILAVVVMFFPTGKSVVVIGLSAGFILIATGWRTAFAVAPPPEHGEATPADRHVDLMLGLPASPAFAKVNARLAENNPLRSPESLRWLGYFVFTLFMIHAVRMGANFSVEGLVPSIAATLGDVLIAVAVFWLVMAPVRLAWRRLSRGLETRLWHARLHGARGASVLAAFSQRAVDFWLERRYAFTFSMKRARGSMVDGLSLALSQGIILAALLVAINSQWGFSWYFNTENWASGIYQAVTGPRVDLWRKAMAEAVIRKKGGDPQSVFRMAPPGVGQNADFSFLVIGDPGEGDASQLSLKDRYLALAQREDVRFVVISSDVIYPAGEMKDYERNFYMPFKGVAKPIYAIPGNHDWFNALGGFAANLMNPEAARASIDARIAVDRGLTLMDGRKRDALVDEAARLRRDYGLATGLQNAPYFDIQTDRFALIALDTGVLQSIDDAQLKWLDGALESARGKFIMAVAGHPRYAGGIDRAPEGSELRKIYDRLEAGGVAVAMAGDTHDFEYYIQKNVGGGRQIHHILNGGGGAYLSIGTALDWPKQPATQDWAYYPSTQAVRTKLNAETPLWKRPALWWINQFNAWPVGVETLSGIFDFNRAPFYQSFVEVQVRPSSNEVRFLLHGVSGPLRWRDLDRSSTPTGNDPNQDVVLTLPLRP